MKKAAPKTTVPSLPFTFNHVLLFPKTHVSNLMSKTECSCLAAIAAHSRVWVLCWRSLCCSNATAKGRNLDGRKGQSPSQLSAITVLREEANMGLLLPESSTVQLVCWKKWEEQRYQFDNQPRTKCVTTRILPSWYLHFSQMPGSATNFLAEGFPNCLYHVNPYHVN